MKICIYIHKFAREKCQTDQDDDDDEDLNYISRGEKHRYIYFTRFSRPDDDTPTNVYFIFSSHNTTISA